MARIITKELALKIAAKLEAVKHAKKNRPHDLYTVSYRGMIVARFGIRRASSKDIGHDYIPGQIHIGPHQALLLAQCPLSRDEWIAIMREKRIIPPDVHDQG